MSEKAKCPTHIWGGVIARPLMCWALMGVKNGSIEIHLKRHIRGEVVNGHLGEVCHVSHGRHLIKRSWSQAYKDAPAATKKLVARKGI